MIWRRFSTRHAWRISMVVGVLAAVLFAGGTVAAQEEFRRADVNQDSTFDLADAAHGLNYLLGFSEASSFVRAFKRWTGHSPTAYLDQAS